VKKVKKDQDNILECYC